MVKSEVTTKFPTFETLKSILHRNATRTALLTCLIAGLAGHYTLLRTIHFGTEDSVLFYLSGLNIVHSEKLEELNQRAIDYYTKQGVDEHELLRLKLRKDYLNEFAFPGAVLFGVGRIFKPLFDPVPKGYPWYLAQTIVFGFVLCFITFFSSLLIIIKSIGRTLFLWALAATLILFSLSEFLPVPYHAFATILVHADNGGLAEALRHLGSLLLRPANQFSLLSFSPRSNFTLLMIGVLALRWSGRYFHAYLLVFLLSFVHLANSGVVLGLLVFVDFLLRPQLFRRPGVLGLVVLTGALFVVRETMWTLVGERALTVAAVGVGSFVLFSLLLSVPQLRQRVSGLREHYRALRAVLLRRGDVAADIIVITTFWLVTVVITYLLVVHLKLFDKLDVFYFWGVCTVGSFFWFGRPSSSASHCCCSSG